jgi:hypothetical protein
MVTLFARFASVRVPRRYAVTSAVMSWPPDAAVTFTATIVPLPGPSSPVQSTMIPAVGTSTVVEQVKPFVADSW